MVKSTKTALKNIEVVADYIAQAFGEFPSVGKVGRVFGTRELVQHENYTTIYRVKDATVQILRIHHSAMKQ